MTEISEGLEISNHIKISDVKTKTEVTQITKGLEISNHIEISD